MVGPHPPVQSLLMTEPQEIYAGPMLAWPTEHLRDGAPFGADPGPLCNVIRYKHHAPPGHLSRIT